MKKDRTHCGEYINEQFGRTKKCSTTDMQCDSCRLIDAELLIETLQEELDILRELNENSPN